MCWEKWGFWPLVPELHHSKQQSCRIKIRNNWKSLIQILHLLGRAFRLSLSCTSRPIALAFLAMALPHLKRASCLLTPAAHATSGSGPYWRSLEAPWCHLKGKCSICWTLACLITAGCLSTSILKGQLGTQTLHIDVLVDLYCQVSEKLSTAEKETLLYSKYLGGMCHSKSSAVLFYSHLRSQKENETGTTSSDRNSSHHIPFTSVLCECEAWVKNVNANVCSFRICWSFSKNPGKLSEKLNFR